MLNYKSKPINKVYKIIKLYIDWIRSSKVLTRLIFGVKPSHCVLNTHWDLTTLVFKKALNMYVEDNQQVLEIGTGHLALLSIYVIKKKNVNVTGVDINPAFVQSAKKNAINNQVNIDILRSDLFSNVHGLFDIVFFNAPYIPIEFGLKHGKVTNSMFDLTWDGGDTGCDTVIRFLRQVSSVCNANTKILLGINTFYIPHTKMKEIIHENNLKLISVVSSVCNPSKVYVLKVDN